MNTQEIEYLLKQKNIKSTAMRNLVLQYFLTNNKAVALKDLEVAFHYSDRTTLFRTIKTFEEKALIHNIKDGSNTTKYALCNANCSAKHHMDIHPHFYCEKCKTTSCLRKVSIPTIVLENDFSIYSTELILKGVCKDCNSVA